MNVPAFRQRLALRIAPWLLGPRDDPKQTARLTAAARKSARDLVERERLNGAQARAEYEYRQRRDMERRREREARREKWAGV